MICACCAYNCACLCSQTASALDYSALQTTISGFGGAPSVFNGSWTLPKVSRCCYKAASSDPIIRMCNQLDGFFNGPVLSLETGGTIYRYTQSGAYNCCDETPTDNVFNYYDGTGGAHPSSITLSKSGPCQYCQPCCNYDYDWPETLYANISGSCCLSGTTTLNWTGSSYQASVGSGSCACYGLMELNCGGGAGTTIVFSITSVGGLVYNQRCVTHGDTPFGQTVHTTEFSCRPFHAIFRNVVIDNDTTYVSCSPSCDCVGTPLTIEITE